MTKEELKALHPELYASVVTEAAAQATADERDRVTAHLTMGAKAGMTGLVVAIEAIESGEALGPKAQQKYFDAILNRRDQDDRQVESDMIAGIASGARAGTSPASSHEGSSGHVVGNPDEEGDLGDQVAHRMRARRGRSPHAEQEPPSGPAPSTPRAAPARGPDLGDQVAALMLQRRGRAPTQAPSRQGA